MAVLARGTTKGMWKASSVLPDGISWCRFPGLPVGMLSMFIWKTNVAIGRVMFYAVTVRASQSGLPVTRRCWQTYTSGLV